MKPLPNYLAKMRLMDFYDYLAHLQALIAQLKGRLFYTHLFGAFGRKSWLKKPDQIFGPSRIFIGDYVRIEKGAVLYAVKQYAGVIHGGRITIGRSTFMNRSFNASSAFSIDIGEEVAFGSNVFLCDFDHSYSDPKIGRITSPLVSKGPIRIGHRCWIGANVYVTSGVELGDGCVVGANSVVTRSFPGNTVIAGAPARVIRRWSESSNQWERVAQDDAKPNS